jgi:hypothetical protein
MTTDFTDYHGWETRRILSVLSVKSVVQFLTSDP